MAIGSTRALVSYPSSVPTTYGVQNDNEAATSAVLTTQIYSRSAEGEVPQLQAVIESRGGEDAGITTIVGGVEVSAVQTLTGAAIDGGLSGTDAV
jgi:hypothetical protein